MLIWAFRMIWRAFSWRSISGAWSTRFRIFPLFGWLCWRLTKVQILRLRSVKPQTPAWRHLGNLRTFFLNFSWFPFAAYLCCIGVLHSISTLSSFIESFLSRILSAFVFPRRLRVGFGALQACILPFFLIFIVQHRRSSPLNISNILIIFNIGFTWCSPGFDALSSRTRTVPIGIICSRQAGPKT